MKAILKYLAIAFIFFILVWVWVLQIENNLYYSEFVSGGILFIIVLFLSLFNARKRLPFLPLAPAHRWFLFHTIGGFLAFFLFMLHVNVFWPKGFYVQILAFLFYAATLSGALGLIMEKVYP